MPISEGVQDDVPGAGQGDVTAAVLLRVDSVSRTYRSRQGDVVALQDASFDVGAGEFVSIVGTSGCGKSTLLGVIAGLTPPTTGSVSILGRRVEAPDRAVGMMFQKPVLLPWRDVLQNVLLPIEVMKLDRRAYGVRARSLLEMAGLADFAQHKIWQLSGGMQQRVALCRALITEPSILLLDEPFGALDSLTREVLNDALRELCSQTGITTVLVTHDVQEAVYLSDRVLVMSRRPGSVVREIHVDLGDRDATTRATTAFVERCAELREALRQVHAL